MSHIGYVGNVLEVSGRVNRRIEGIDFFAAVLLKLHCSLYRV